MADFVQTDEISEDSIFEVLSPETLRKNQRIFSTAEEDVMEDIILAVFYYFHGPEGWLRRCLLEQGYYLYLNSFPLTGFEIPIAPVQVITDIESKDLTGTYVSVAGSTYNLDQGGIFPRVVLAPQQTWPTFASAPRMARISIVAGYASAELVPAPIKRAMVLLAGHLFQNREATYSDQRVSFVSRRLEFGIAELAGRYKIANDAYREDEPQC